MSNDQKFTGWIATDGKAIEGNLKWDEYEPTTWDESHIDVKVQYCGMCGSDIATLSGEFGPISKPTIVGHEIVGEVIKVGSKVEGGIKVGDIVGIGAQCDSCRECEWCEKGREQYCAEAPVQTYASDYKRGASKGETTKGGYATHWRGPSHFAVVIPEGLDPAFAAPMMCGAGTVYSPLVQYGCGEGKKVGVVGVGGLGHFALLFASALGAEVTAISHSESKKDDAMKMGAKAFIATGDDVSAAFKEHQKSLDIVICTSNGANLPINDYISLLRPSGTLIFVGIPKGEMPPLNVPAMLFGTYSCGQKLTIGNVNIAGSLIASPGTLKELLAFAAEKKVQPWIQKFSMKDANKAVVDMTHGKPRYRYVLVNEEHGGKL